MSVKIYGARAMTGRYCDVLWKEAMDIKALCDKHSVELYDPVTREGIPNEHIIIPNRVGADGDVIWEEDKRAIREECHVVVDFTAHLKSEGVLHEVGLQRYAYWSPVVRVLPIGADPAMISVREDDVIVFSREDAITVVKERWGTWQKRFKWRVLLYRRCRLKAFWTELYMWIK